MSDLADLFPGFASRWIDTRHGRLFARTGGAGPPLLLVHGFPQTHVEWHAIAPALAERFTLIVPDLPGYGWSAAPAAGPDQAPYSKRGMGEALTDLLDALGHGRVACVGHDRGARVGYRLALDHPGRVERLAVIDIVPTFHMWHGMDRRLAHKVYHWTFLAQPAPLPERLIGADPRFYLDWTLASWTAAKDLSAFDPRALAHYRAFFAVPDRIAACCADYRAGASVDLAHDEADRAAGRMILCPLLALWGQAGIPGEGPSPLDVWRQWAPQAAGGPIAGGHFLPEENPAATLAALLPFLTG